LASADRRGKVEPGTVGVDVETDSPENQRGGSSMGGLARGSMVAIVGTLVSQGSLLFTVALIAAKLGSTGLGIFSQAYAVLTLATLAAMVGMQTSLTRYVAGYVAAGDWADIRPTVRLGMGVACGVALLVAVLVAAVSPWLANDVLREPGVATPLVLAAVALPFAVYSRTAGAVLQGHHRMRDFVVVTLMVEPGVRLVGMAVVLFAGGGIDAAAGVLVFSNVAASAWGWHRMRSTMLPVARRQPVKVRPFLRFSAATWVASLATTGLVWLDTLLLGIYRPSDEVGVYQVATRLVALATLGSVPIASAFAPRITRMIQRQDWVNLSAAYGATTTWSTRLAVPGLALCLVVPGPLLGLFGAQYTTAAAVTVILVVGKLVEAATGPCGMVLNMSSRVGLNATNNVVALAVNIGLNVLLIPRFGLVGAAIAWSVSLVLVNLARLIEVRATIGLRLFEPEAGKAIAAVVPGALLAWLVVVLVDSPLVELALTTVLVVGGYAVITRWLTWTSNDRVVAAALRDAVLPARAATDAQETGTVQSDNGLAPSPAGAAVRGSAEGPQLTRPGNGDASLTSIAALISPLRLDVVIRADFFKLIEAHGDLWRTDRRAFMELAYQHDYWIWYRDIASQLGMTSRHGALQKRGFERRVERSVTMLQQFATEGYDTRRPISLWRVAEVRPTATGKLLRRSVFMGDGCHRLALLHNAGVEYLAPDMVQWRSIGTFAPRDNTHDLLQRTDMSEQRLLAFLASGYGVEVGPSDTLQTVLDRLPPDEAEEFAAVAALDLAALRRKSSP
jgi:O-antigen/teichoic acid export membrane protein